MSAVIKRDSRPPGVKSRCCLCPADMQTRAVVLWDLYRRCFEYQRRPSNAPPRQLRISTKHQIMRSKCGVPCISCSPGVLLYFNLQHQGDLPTSTFRHSNTTAIARNNDQAICLFSSLPGDAGDQKNYMGATAVKETPDPR